LFPLYSGDLWGYLEELEEALRGSIIIHIDWKDKPPEHLWIKTQNLVNEVGGLLLGQREATRKAFQNKIVMIPTATPHSDIADCKDWLSPETACRYCAIKDKP
jgi:hypothetical protein